jgi:hypothetical protein
VQLLAPVRDGWVIFFKPTREIWNERSGLRKQNLNVCVSIRLQRGEPFIELNCSSDGIGQTSHPDPRR